MKILLKIKNTSCNLHGLVIQYTLKECGVIRKTEKFKYPAIKQLPSGSYTARVYIGKDEKTGIRKYQSITASTITAVKNQCLEASRTSALLEHQKHQRKTVGDAVDEFITSRTAVLSPRTVREYKQEKDRIPKMLSEMPLSDLTQQCIQDTVNDWSKNVSPKTVRNRLGLLHGSCTPYVDSRIFHVTLPQKVKPSIQIPTEEEVQKIIAKVKGTEMEIPVLLGAMRGMRRSEIAGLKWSDIDFEKLTMSIDSAIVLGEDGYVSKGTKNVSSQRHLKIPDYLLDALNRHKNDTEYVVTINPSSITHRFEHVLYSLHLKKYRFHDLRHYFVSVCLALNIPKSYIAAMVGHSSEDMINRVYGHIMESKKNDFDAAITNEFDAMIQHNNYK